MRVLDTFPKARPSLRVFHTVIETTPPTIKGPDQPGQGSEPSYESPARPRLNRWEVDQLVVRTYEAIFQQAPSDPQQPDGVVSWHLLTAWGNTSLDKKERSKEE